jgi:hypothetical protein
MSREKILNFRRNNSGELVSYAWVLVLVVDGRGYNLLPLRFRWCWRRLCVS